MIIKLNTIGKILQGDNSGFYVKIVPDDNGSFLVLLKPSLETDEGFDDWVQSMELLDDYIVQSKWVIEWL